MTLLEYIKKFSSLDIYILLLDEIGLKDVEIIDRLQISKQYIYNVRERQKPFLEAITGIDMADKPDPRNKDVQAIIDTFMEINGTTSASRYDRFAAKRLADKHGANNIVQLIKAIGDTPPGKYKPVVGSVSDLEKKWVSLKDYFAKNGEVETLD